MADLNETVAKIGQLWPLDEPAYLITLDRPMSAQQLDELRALWRHHLPNKRLIVLPPGMSARPLTWLERVVLNFEAWRRARGSSL